MLRKNYIGAIPHIHTHKNKSMIIAENPFIYCHRIL